MVDWKGFISNLGKADRFVNNKWLHLLSSAIIFVFVYFCKIWSFSLYKIKLKSFLRGREVHCHYFKHEELRSVERKKQI